ncbi:MULTISPECIES: glycoside hydrolase family 43 protein [unclassified Microbacterium]|uniref:glycoside hydrolase family 43 protein n=1 Tax=unclassified Microbacterium TaxID=2609290 RepID=UPI003864D787
MSARSPLAGLGALALVALLVGCAGPEPGAPSESSSPAAETADGGAFVIDEDFPDPDVVEVEGGFAAFATGSHGLNIRVARSDDLADWQVERRDALPVLPAWASPGRTWAPEVVATGDGFTMYVTAQHTESGRQCIGVATAASVDEAFTPEGDEPLVCPVDEGGAIDAATFDDADGSRYLLWKTDGNCCSLDTWLMMAPLSADGRTLAGEPFRLISQGLEWEGALVEAPTLIERDGVYHLLYSANDYGSDAYAVGAASADALTGPWEKQPEPVLATSSSGGRYLGPGGQDVVATPGGDVLVFHGWDEQYIYRGMHTAPVSFEGGTVAVG